MGTSVWRSVAIGLVVVGFGVGALCPATAACVTAEPRPPASCHDSEEPSEHERCCSMWPPIERRDGATPVVPEPSVVRTETAHGAGAATLGTGRPHRECRNRAPAGDLQALLRVYLA